ncbi:MarR family transcriptional regulator [Rhodococcus fascians]|nr:MarR family transcriptional regulator [Rhodococcus fascians]
MTEPEVDRSPSSPEPTLRHAIRHVSRVYQAQFRTRLNAHGIGDAEYVAMFVIRRLPGISSAELARWNGVTTQASFATVKQLHDAGLIIRYPSPTHGKIVCTELSERGHEVMIACEQQANELEKEMCRAMNVQDRIELERLLLSCAEGLGEPIAPVGAVLGMPPR